jgi:hypothetical protein
VRLGELPRDGPRQEARRGRGTDPKRSLVVRRYPHGELPVVQARQRCWLEHAAHLQQFVGDVTARRVAIDVAPGAGGSPQDTHEAL